LKPFKASSLVSPAPKSAADSLNPYRIFYTVGAPTPEILAILHSARDIHSIITVRLQ
jgi:hypothetical protein